MGRNIFTSVYFWLASLYSEKLNVSRCAPGLRRNDIAIFGMAVAYIINIFLFLWSADHKAFLIAHGLVKRLLLPHSSLRAVELFTQSVHHVPGQKSGPGDPLFHGDVVLL